MKRLLQTLVVVLIAALFSQGAENVSGKQASLKKSLATSDVWIDVSRMEGVFRNNGTWLYDNVAGGEGLFWPKGTHNSPIFAGGQWLGALVDGEVHVACVQHSSSEYQPGEILSPGVAANPDHSKYRWYVLRPGGVGDWINWPVDQGAQMDANGDPLLIGDVTAFSVWNDLAEHRWREGKPLGAEVRQTVFAHNRVDVLGDVIFIKWQIVNKGDADWDSTHFGIWLDPDLGDAGDDLVGCDTTLDLGFCYNATDNDQSYGAAPPAVGICLLQGPIIDDLGGAVTLPDGTVMNDKAMFKMTSFIYYNGDDTPWGNPKTSSDFWNYLRGYWQDGLRITEGERGRNPANPPANFMFPGDPETGIGWLDYDECDRRLLMIMGPFDMPVWVDENSSGVPDFAEPGVQEIVAAVIVARGGSHLNSVTELKAVADLARLVYSRNFILAYTPAVPDVSVSELPNEILLTWNDKSEWNAVGAGPYSSTDPTVARVYGDTVILDNAVRVIDDSTYNFYGYTVYQYSDAGGRAPVAIGHWDVGRVAYPRPYYGSRFVRILENRHLEAGEMGTPLINGKEYYFSVVAEGYLEFGSPAILPSVPTILTAVPQYQPGVSYTSAHNDTLEVTHSVTDVTKTPSDGSVVVWVVDPSRTTGLDYDVTFNEDMTWNLVRSDGDTVAGNQQNLTGNDAYTVYDGLLVTVRDPLIPWDVFSFTAPDPSVVMDSLLVADLDKINVVPNPYYGVHSGEMNIVDWWVQFTYLPPRCTIRIFDLAGNLIRKLEKNDAGTTFLRWDLRNVYDSYVASGVYIYMVDTDYGQKIGKLAVFATVPRTY